MELLTPELIEKAGIGVVALIVFYLSLKLFMEQWKNSTNAVNKNTTAFNRLSKVFEESSERERLFQKELMETLRNGVAVAEDTNERVRDLQSRIGGNI